jgi:uncharacterized protein YbjT (DUF2867 family)
MYVITGASGNTGARIANTLLDAGKKVRVIGRSQDKLSAFAEKGAEIAVGDLTDTAFLTSAFQGAEAVYLMVPPSYQSNDMLAHQVAVVNAAVPALKSNNVKNIVTLSSIGAHLESGSGVVQGLNVMENELAKLENTNVLNLRAGYFMENTLGQIGTIKQAGIMGSPVKGDLSFPAVATQDIAKVASDRLLNLDFEGNSNQYVAGSRNVTYNEVASILGAAIGKPDLQYVEFPAEAFKAAVSPAYMSDNVADRMNEFISALNDGKILEEFKRDETNTTATSIEDFAHVFAHVYNM